MKKRPFFVLYCIKNIRYGYWVHGDETADEWTQNKNNAAVFTYDFAKELIEHMISYDSDRSIYINACGYVLSDFDLEESDKDVFARILDIDKYSFLDLSDG